MYVSKPFGTKACGTNLTSTGKKLRYQNEGTYFRKLLACNALQESASAFAMKLHSCLLHRSGTSKPSNIYLQLCSFFVCLLDTFRSHNFQDTHLFVYCTKVLFICTHHSALPGGTKGMSQQYHGFSANSSPREASPGVCNVALCDLLVTNNRKLGKKRI